MVLSTLSAHKGQTEWAKQYRELELFLTKNAPGMTPTDPLYMATVEPSARSQSWKFFSKVALWFIALSFIGAVLDEKTGGAGGISSRLTGLSSIVHQAEQSDK